MTKLLQGLLCVSESDQLSASATGVSMAGMYEYLGKPTDASTTL